MAIEKEEKKEKKNLSLIKKTIESEKNNPLNARKQTTDKYIFFFSMNKA